MDGQFLNKEILHLAQTIKGQIFYDFQNHFRLSKNNHEICRQMSSDYRKTIYDHLDQYLKFPSIIWITEGNLPFLKTKSIIWSLNAT